MNPWLKLRKIARLPGVRITPQVLLAQTLEKAAAGHIKSCMIAIEWDDGTCCVDYSNVNHKVHALMAMLVLQEVQKCISQGGETLL